MKLICYCILSPSPTFLPHQEAKVTHILTCLNKTSPPVLIFAEKKQDVDLIQEYLLLKGVTAAAIHGGKDQEERSAAVQAFQVLLNCLSLFCVFHNNSNKCLYFCHSQFFYLKIHVA